MVQRYELAATGPGAHGQKVIRRRLLDHLLSSSWLKPQVIIPAEREELMKTFFDWYSKQSQQVPRQTALKHHTEQLCPTKQQAISTQHATSILTFMYEEMMQMEFSSVNLMRYISRDKKQTFICMLNKKYSSLQCAQVFWTSTPVILSASVYRHICYCAAKFRCRRPARATAMP
jgi:hypothetical protein